MIAASDRPSPSMMDRETDSPPLTGQFAGRYEILRELGEGATSRVYLARDTVYGREVALKVLRP
jgi:serine/threonine protein kinase